MLLSGNRMASTVLQLEEVELSLDEDDARDLIAQIRPQWKPEDIKCERLMKGLVNQMWSVKNSAAEDDDAIAIKIYGGENDHLMNRSREKILMEVLNQYGISLPLYAVFKNGFASKFTKGSNLTREQLFDLNISKLVIDKMHCIHALDQPDYKAEDAMELTKAVLGGWEAYRDAMKEDPSYQQHFNHEAFSAAILNIEKVWSELNEDFPPCFCHRDMHRLNLLYNPDNHDLAVIDWELAGRVPQVEDIARHLCMDPDSKVYESGVLIPEKKDFIAQFLRLYLETHPEYGKQPVSQELVDKWLIGTYKAMEVTLLLTTIWALVQWKTREGRDFFRFAMEMEHVRTIIVEMMKTDLKKRS